MVKMRVMLPNGNQNKHRETESYRRASFHLHILLTIQGSHSVLKPYYSKGRPFKEVFNRNGFLFPLFFNTKVVIYVASQIGFSQIYVGCCLFLPSCQNNNELKATSEKMKIEIFN